MIKAVCFDLDGTLVDSERLYLQGNVYAAQQLGYRLTFEDFLPLVGISEAQFQRQLDQLIKPSQQTEFARLTQALVNSRIAQTQSLAQPGADHLLTFLRAHHIKLALVTTSTAEYTQRILTNTGWHNGFDVVVTREQGLTKPAPDLYLQALQQLHLANAQVLAVEDSPVGVCSAKAAGLKCVQVQDLAPLTEQADQQVAHLFELEKMLRA
jgi:HAD superfamily hydrolase (TIGR01509 family)